MFHRKCSCLVAKSIHINFVQLCFCEFTFLKAGVQFKNSFFVKFSLLSHVHAISDRVNNHNCIEKFKMFGKKLTVRSSKKKEKKKMMMMKMKKKMKKEKRRKIR